MLYRSTRNKLDSFTAYRALRIDRADDGGFILPIRVPEFDAEKIAQMRNADILQNVADVLSLFFGEDLTAWDIESIIGKTPVHLVECGQKVVIAQCWKNPASKMEYFEQSLYSLLCGGQCKKPTLWSKVAIRISVMIATMLQCSEKEVDIAVNAADFIQLFAAYYCRRMGMPVRKILVGCNENSNVWDFVYRGTMQCGASLQKTAYPDQDKVVPEHFEAYLFLTYGYEETLRYLDSVSNKQVYQLPEGMQIPASDNLFVSVIGQERIPAVINSFHANNNISINPYTAFSLGALQDYRAKAGESCTTIVFEESAP